MKIQVIGLCRFSVPVEGGFQIEHGTLADRRAFLYAPERLEERFLWFEQVFLPSIRKQTDPDFRLIVLAGADLPEPWRSRLSDGTADVPQIDLQFRSPGNHRDLCRWVMAEAASVRSADVLAEFRLDDDDAVALNYIRRIRDDFRDCLAGYYRAKGRVFADQSRGVVLDARTDPVAVRPVAVPHWTPGLTLYLPPETDSHIMDFPHHRILHSMSGMNFQDEVMYLRGRHTTNDSDGWGGQLGEPFAEARATDVLRRRFGIDLPRFARTCAAIRGARGAVSRHR